MIPINFTIYTYRLVTVHTKKFVLSLRMVLTIPEVSGLLCNLYSHVLLKVGRRLMNLFIAIITVVALIIFAINSSLLSTIITVLLHARKESLMLGNNPELDKMSG